jgi:signal transduction histidine kinase
MMTAGAKPDHAETSLLNLPPNSRQRQIALGIVLILPVGFAVTALLATTPLPRVNAFIPILAAMVFLNDLITSILLFGQFSIIGSRALLALASGYLFTSLIVIPYALTFPDAFSPSGLLGAGLQSTAWLYLFWHGGFPAAIAAYVWLREEDRARKAMRVSTPRAIGLSVTIVVGLVCGLASLATAGERFLPRLFLDVTHTAPLSPYVLAVDGLISLLALLLLWSRRQSLLDLCLMVVTCTWITELAMTGLINNARFSLGFYVGRLLSFLTSTVVLAMLVSESTTLYARLAHSNATLRRERDNKLMNLEALAAAISHEVRQPLSAIEMNGGAALRFVGREPVDVEETRSALNDMVSDSRRIAGVLDNVRTLFGKTDWVQEPIDVNETVLGGLRILRGELSDHGITVRVELASELPPVMGNRVQLQEVVLNLFRNAVEAMDAVTGDFRVLKAKTEHQDRQAVIIEVEDSGPGISPERAGSIFDAFVTTKPQGMGLGLALCRMIIERHEGHLSVWPAHPRGSIFRIVLPQKNFPH